MSQKRAMRLGAITYVVDSHGYWHVPGLHPMGLVKLKGKTQLGFPTTHRGACPVCKAQMEHKEPPA